MARIRKHTHEINTYFCGHCGIILAYPRKVDLWDNCPKCKTVIEP